MLTSSNTMMTVFRWIARVLAVGLFLFWGLFFVEHTREWFMTGKGWPPRTVIIFQILHGVMLFALLLGWVWEIGGGVLLILSAIFFFTQVANPSAGGFISGTIVPGVIWLITGGHHLGITQARRENSQTPG